jgi:NADH dehydrogenase
VHLAGILIESRASTYKKANVDTAAAIAEAARRSGLEHIVLVSVIGADSDSPNRYLRSKGDAERLVTGSGVPSTIIRTPILLGRNTAGAAGLVRVAKQKKVRLLDGGRYQMRPLDLDDLSRAILSAIENRGESVSIYTLVGPESLRYHELVSRTADMMGRSLSIGTMPVWIAKTGAAIRSRIKGGGLSPTVIDVLIADESVEMNADIELGIELTPLSVTLEKILSDLDED